MSYIRDFFTFLYDFIIGDDWTIAAAVVVALALVDWLSRSWIQAWWLLPLVVIAVTGMSLQRADKVPAQSGQR